MKKFFVQCSFFIGVLCASAYGFVLKEEISKNKDEVVIVYPNEEQNGHQFQNRKSDSFATIDIPMSPKNVLNQNGRNEKLSHCQQNLGCIAQFMCSDRPFDYGTSCEYSLWPADSPDFGIGWSFNALTGKCQSFLYGGCDGTLNTFKTRTECESLCEPKGKSKPRSPAGVMAPVTDFFKSVMAKVNNIPNWIQERFGKRRLDSKVDNVQEGSKQVEVKVDESGMEHEKVKNDCWIPIFCSMQKKVQSWFQDRTGSRRFNIEKPMMQQHVPSFGRRRL